MKLRRQFFAGFISASLFVFVPAIFATNVGGVISANTIWALSGNPFVVTSSVTVASAATLTIEPGVSVLFNNGLGMTIQGRLLAEGDATNRIRFSRSTNATSWTRLSFTTSALESRIRFADIDHAASSGNITATSAALFLESVVFTNTTTQLLNLNSSSITMLNCILPTISGAESVHGNGLPANGHAVFRGNIFGSTTGANDIIDFTGGQRPGAIVQFYDNIFLGGSDDALDLDGTDAHIEGNIFLNVHTISPTDTGSAISGGMDGPRTSRLMIVRNLFYNCDHGTLCKDNGFSVIQNNTFVSMANAAINFDEPLRTDAGPGAGAIVEGNIIWNTATNFENVYLNDPTNGTIALIANRNLFSGNDHTNGVGNLTVDPLFIGTNGVTAENIRALFSLQTNSPAIRSGPNGLDRGALVPAGASISGEPSAMTTNTSAPLTIAGPGIVAYQWRLNSGAWSAEIPLTNSLAFSPTLFSNALPIVLTNLAPGSYTVSVIGKNSAGAWQETNSPTVSKTWNVVPPSLFDSDGDGLPDEWEIANGLDRFSAVGEDGANGNPDGDAQNNLQEYLAGTNPRNATDFFHIESVSLSGTNVTLRFQAAANHSYSVLFSDDSLDGPWQKLVDVAGSPNPVRREILDQRKATGNRFYRLVVPATP